MLQSEAEKLNDLVDRETGQIEAMEEIIAVLDNLEEKHNSGALDHDLAVQAFTKLKDEFPREFADYELHYCGQTVVIPLVKSSLANWNNLLSGRNASLTHLTTFTQWRDILDTGHGDDDYSHGDSESPMPAYHSLVWECWLPHVRLAVQRWHSREPQPLVSFLELWRPLLPDWILQHVLERLVLARLQAEVELLVIIDCSFIHSDYSRWSCGTL